MSAPRRSRRSARGALRSRGVEPVVRLAGWALRTGVGRIAVWLLAPFGGAAARRARHERWVRRSTARAVAMLGALKGVFVKAGQFAAFRHDVASGSATSALADLRDRVPPLPFSRVRVAVERELGAPLGALFTEFDPEPLGAASIAQVHRAVLPNGDAVAVKVQYPWLADSLDTDLALCRFALRVALRLRHVPGLDVGRIFAEFESGIRDELDFEREATIAGEIAANLARDEQIVVPTVVPSHSTRRVLTVRYIPAIRITDRAGLLRLGVVPADVIAIIARAYAKQVFVDGLFHADPHPGNLFVLDEPDAGARPRVLFVDFGLSRRLPPDLRREIRQGLFAVVKRDAGAFVDAMQRMGMIAPGAEPRVRRSVDAMLERIGAGGGALGLAGDRVLELKDEAKRLLQETEGVQLPNDLLLFARTLTYVFSLAHELDPETDLIPHTLPYLLRFLAEAE